MDPAEFYKKLFGQLADNLFRITESVKQFKDTAADFNQTQRQLKESTQWVNELGDQFNELSQRIEITQGNTQELVIFEGDRSLRQSVGEESANTPAPAAADSQSAEEMFAEIRSRWDGLVERLKTHVGPDQFDARSVGQMAWKLADGRRTNPRKPADAELVERLYSQMKRFNRLQRSKDEWLTHDINLAFMRGVE